MRLMNKRAQFFILSAVIIAAIIVSITSTQNYIGSADAPKKFYYYSQQLEDETGSVVNYALYSDPTGTSTSVKSNLNNFLQQGISNTLAAYPDMELFSCYSNITDSGWLICQNNGTKSMVVNTSGMVPRTVYGSRDPAVTGWVCTRFNVDGTCRTIPPATVISFSIAGKDKLTIVPNNSKTYSIPLGNSSIQRGQFYFIATINATGGQYVSQSNDPKTLVS